MDVVSLVKNYYSGFLIGGIVLLALANIFAFVDFTRTKPTDYTWRALSIVTFIVGIILVTGLLLFVGYGSYCSRNIDSVRFNSSDIELNAQ